MSTGYKTSLAKATRIADAFLTLITDVTAAEICGSIRRQRPTVGDIEIVCLPENRGKLLARLDGLVAEGTCRKATYGDSLRHRWGDTYRGLMFEGVKIEVFCAVPENHGFIRWLRTGPAEANMHVMTRMQQENWPVRFREGFAWHDAAGGASHKLDASDEQSIFAFLGIDYVTPENRSVPAYIRVCDVRPTDEQLRAWWLKGVPQQSSMF
jgi:DNA polymerase/3'-5' exonuclease PolX